MSPILLLAATAALGVEVGWEPLPEGGHEYTIQLEPELLHLLESGQEDLFSEVPPEIHIRRYRLTVGNRKLPRDAGEPTPAAAPREPTPAVADPAAPAHAPGEPTPASPDFPPDQSASDKLPPPPSDKVGDGTGGATFAPEHREPGKLPEADASSPIQPAKFDDATSKAQQGGRSEETLQKPQLKGEPTSRPWGVLLGSMALLCCSLGANVYLGWVAWEARHRYRSAVEKFLGTGGA